MKVDNKKQAGNVLKIQTFHELKTQYLKGSYKKKKIIISYTRGNPGITNYKRIIIRRGDEKNTNIHLYFDI